MQSQSKCMLQSAEMEIFSSYGTSLILANNNIVNNHDLNAKVAIPREPRTLKLNELSFKYSLVENINNVHSLYKTNANKNANYCFLTLPNVITYPYSHNLVLNNFYNRCVVNKDNYYESQSGFVNNGYTLETQVFSLNLVSNDQQNCDSLSKSLDISSIYSEHNYTINPPYITKNKHNRVQNRDLETQSLILTCNKDEQIFDPSLVNDNQNLNYGCADADKKKYDFSKITNLQLNFGIDGQNLNFCEMRSSSLFDNSIDRQHLNAKSLCNEGSTGDAKNLNTRYLSLILDEFCEADFRVMQSLICHMPPVTNLHYSMPEYRIHRIRDGSKEYICSHFKAINDAEITNAMQKELFVIDFVSYIQYERNNVNQKSTLMFLKRAQLRKVQKMVSNRKFKKSKKSVKSENVQNTHGSLRILISHGTITFLTDDKPKEIEKKTANEAKDNSYDSDCATENGETENFRYKLRTQRKPNLKYSSDIYNLDKQNKFDIDSEEEDIVQYIGAPIVELDPFEFDSPLNEKIDILVLALKNNADNVTNMRNVDNKKSHTFTVPWDNVVLFNAVASLINLRESEPEIMDYSEPVVKQNGKKQKGSQLSDAASIGMANSETKKNCRKRAVKKKNVSSACTKRNQSPSKRVAAPAAIKRGQANKVVKCVESVIYENGQLSPENERSRRLAAAMRARRFAVDLKIRRARVMRALANSRARNARRIPIGRRIRSPLNCYTRGGRFRRGYETPQKRLFIILRHGIGRSRVPRNKQLKIV